MQTIGHESAKKKFQKIINAVREGCKGHVFVQEPESVFPLTGYDTNSISKTALIDYRDKGYDYFTGNAHLGHPGVDLNILDNDRDGIDDNLKKTVKVVSMTEGIVLDLEEKWKPESLINDGNFILIYDFGGGTFDLTLITKTGNQLNVIAKDGVTKLGGKEFDEIVHNSIRESYQKSFGCSFPDDRLTANIIASQINNLLDNRLKK